MLKTGLVDELISLRERYPLRAEMPSMRCVGYRQTWQFLDGEINRNVLRENAIIATRQLAKRQLTWLRAMPAVLPIDCLRSDFNEVVVKQVAEFLRQS